MSVKQDKGMITNRERLQHGIAGALARVTEVIIMYPMDVAKTRLQFQGKHLTNVKSYKGVFNALYVIGKDEGVKGFTRGMLPKFVYIIPAAAVSFLCYEEISSAFHNWDGKAMGGSNAAWIIALPLIGMFSARIVGSLCRSPFDVLKQRMQIQGSLDNVQFKNSKQALLYISKTEGIASLFSYAHVALLRDIPFSAVYFSLYELLKTTQAKYKAARGKSVSMFDNFIAGGLSGMVATTVTIPLDVVKTKLQTQIALPAKERIYNGVIHTLKDIAQKEGIAGLTRGLSARILYLTPASAIVFTAYEQYKKMLVSVI